MQSKNSYFHLSSPKYKKDEEEPDVEKGTKYVDIHVFRLTLR
jgi:hypothetical protein